MEKSQKYSAHDIILDSIADGVFTVNNDWQITSFNRAAEEIVGISRDQAIGQKCYEVFRADVCQNACKLRSTLENGKEVINHRVNIVNNEGETLPISISTAVLKDNNGSIVGGVETFRDLSTEELLRKEIQEKYTYADIISKSHEIRKIFDILPDIAESDSTVLIEGASGTGKELFAKAIHNLSKRHEKPYIVVNCSALPETLLESELFGYVKGAFTDAKKDKLGRFARAEGGTLFIDEIGTMSNFVQVKLLRALQEKEYEPLGSTKTFKANVRIIAATNKNLSHLVEEDKFRDDLYYRLNVFKIELPPLKNRLQDIPLLVEHFIGQFNTKKRKEILGISQETLEILMNHDFPGNVRELENIIEHSFILCHGPVIELKHLPDDLVRSKDKHISIKKQFLENPVDHAEVEVIKEILSRNNGNRQKTAIALGMHKTTLWRKMKKYNLI